MIAYEVKVNGKRVATVGLEHGGVLSLIANWVSRPDDVTWDDARDWGARFRVGGLRDGRRGLEEYLTWFRRDLRVGDEISMRLIETGSVDEPVEVKRKRRKKRDDSS